MTGLCSDCTPDADLSDALGDAREHDVCNADAAHDECDARDEDANKTGLLRLLLDGVAPFLSRIESEILNPTVGSEEDAAHFFERWLHIIRVGYLEGEFVYFVIWSGVVLEQAAWF